MDGARGCREVEDTQGERDVPNHFQRFGKEAKNSVDQDDG
jgi:hypothetical protein